MYCVNCGVKLADTEKVCPLCGVVAFHPDILRPEGERLYPPVPPKQQLSPWGAMIVVTTLFLLPLLITLVCDLTKRQRDIVTAGGLLNYTKENS